MHCSHNCTSSHLGSSQTFRRFLSRFSFCKKPEFELNFPAKIGWKKKMVLLRNPIDIPRQKDFCTFMRLLFISFFACNFVQITHSSFSIWCLRQLQFLFHNFSIFFIRFYFPSPPPKHIVSPGAKERLVQITGPNEEKIKWAIRGIMRPNLKLNSLMFYVFLFLCRIVVQSNWSKIRFVGMHRRSVWMKLDRVWSAVVRVALSIRRIRMKRCREPIEIRFCCHRILLRSQWCTPHSMCRQVKPTNLRVNFAPLKSINRRGNLIMRNVSLFTAGTHGSGGHKSRISGAGTGNQVLLHSLSTNDASLGEYKYTVNVGHNSLKITGDCFDLVRVSFTVSVMPDGKS